MSFWKVIVRYKAKGKLRGKLMSPKAHVCCLATPTLVAMKTVNAIVIFERI